MRSSVWNGGTGTLRDTGAHHGVASAGRMPWPHRRPRSSPRATRRIGKPPYIVFSDKTLRDMCAKRPASPEEFLAVNGVGENKLNLYGERFLAAIAESV